MKNHQVDRSSKKSQFSRVSGPTFFHIFLLYGYHVTLDEFSWTDTLKLVIWCRFKLTLHFVGNKIYLIRMSAFAAINIIAP